MLGLHCCTGFSLVAVSRGCSLVSVHGPLTEVASLAMEHGSRPLGFQQLQHVGSVVVAPRLWSTGSIVWHVGLVVRGMCKQGSDPCLLHWQADSLPLSHQGNPSHNDFYDSIIVLVLGFHGPVFLFSLLLAPFKQMALSEVYLYRMLHRLLLGGIGIVMDYVLIVMDYIYYYTKKILYFI